MHSELPRDYEVCPVCAKEHGQGLPGLEIPVDPGWRPIDLAIDSFEPCGVPERPYLEDQTLLYWWRPTFWRRETADADEEQAKMIWRSLRSALENLGLSVADQIDPIPAVGSHDELALDFDNFHCASWQLRDRGWTSAALDADMNRIDELLSALSDDPTHWTDDALVANEVWSSIRDLARRCLARMPAEPWPAH